MKQFEVKVTRLTNVEDKQYFGGTYYVDKKTADALIGSGNAHVVGEALEHNEEPAQPVFKVTAVSGNKKPLPKAKKDKKGDK